MKSVKPVSPRSFLFAMVNGGGNVPAQMSIARRLVSRGHRVHVLGDPQIEGEAARSGCGFSPYERAPRQNMRDREQDLVRDWESRFPPEQLRRVGDQLLFGPSLLYARDLLDVIARVRPDALAIDCLPFGLIAGAEKSGLPAALLFHMPYNAPVGGSTPFGLGLRQARGPLGRLRDLVLRALIKRMFRPGLVPLNAARKAIGLAPLADVFDQFQALPRTLVLTSRSFDFVPSGLPDNVRYVGAQLDDPAWTESWSSPWADEAQAKLPLVLVSLGSTFQNQGNTLARIIAALGDVPVRALVTLGEQPLAEGVVIPPNVVVVSSAPHADVLPLTSLVVAHGGHGTVMKALAHGVPLVCVPFGRDQSDNGARVEAAGAGLTVSSGASVRRLRTVIERVLSDAKFRVGAERMREIIGRETIADSAVAELEELAGDASVTLEPRRVPLAQPELR